jgi:arsenical pump membrane protein
MLIYAVGVLVTTFLSNDATAVVLTPAVYAAAKAAKAEPLPYLFACAFVANAASFVLPISNPANLVVYASHMPPLLDWLRQFGLPSLLAIATTYAVLRIAQRNSLRRPIAIEVKTAPLTSCGKVAGIGIVLTGAVLMWASAASLDLGLPTFLSGLGTIALILMMKSDTGWRLARDVARHISWGVLPLVAGLFVLVEALEQTGLLRLIAEELRRAAITSEAGAVWGAGSIVALTCNLVNNLPAGLLAGAAVSAADVPAKVAGAVLIGVDLGPNLSVTGSLATILWLVSIRREGANVGAWRFLKLGVVIMPPALVLALGALVLTS